MRMTTFTLSSRFISRSNLIAYVANQREHHRSGRIVSHLEQTVATVPGESPEPD